MINSNDVISLPFADGDIEINKLILSIYIVAHLLFLITWIYRYFKFKINKKKDIKMKIDNIWKYIIADDNSGGLNFSTFLFVYINGVILFIALSYKIATFL